MTHKITTLFLKKHEFFLNVIYLINGTNKFAHATEYHLLYIMHTFGKRKILAPLIFKNAFL